MSLILTGFVRSTDSKLFGVVKCDGSPTLKPALACWGSCTRQAEPWQVQLAVVRSRGYKLDRTCLFLHWRIDHSSRRRNAVRVNNCEMVLVHCSLHDEALLLSLLNVT
jgi:hypothetical protein